MQSSKTQLHSTSWPFNNNMETFIYLHTFSSRNQYIKSFNLMNDTNLRYKE